MSALRLHTPVILLALMTLLLPATPVWAAVTDYYVDAANGDDGNMGTSGFPFATIHQGIAQVVSDGVPGRVFVREGTYDNDHESTYAGSNPGYPIDLSNGVEVIGDEEDPEDWPRIGGDVSASTAETYFRVVLDTGATWEGIRVENLYFEGESPSGDAPTAFYARVTNESELLGAAFVGNICERPVQASATRAVVALEAGDGGVLGDGEEGEWILISDNIITASRLGGIEIRTLTDEADYDVHTAVKVIDNQISVSGAEAADFGIRWGGASATDAYHKFFVIGNRIDSSEATSGGGVTTGIHFVATAGDASVTFAGFSEGSSKVSYNKIYDCLGDGIWVDLDATGEVQAFFATANMTNNIVTGCCGAGINLDWGAWPSGDPGSSQGRYLHVDTFGNLLVENCYGIWFNGFETFGASAGDSSLTNDTIAGNTVGIKLDGDIGGNTNIPYTIRNIIVWDNGTAIVHDYNDGSVWAPLTDSDVKYSNIEGLLGSCASPDGNGNIDCDPLFISAYRLGTSSPCVDAGTNTPRTFPDVPRFDVDGNTRKVQGDWDCTGVEIKVLDMGAQETQHNCS